MANADTDARCDPRNPGREAAGDASVHREHRRRRASRTPDGGSGRGPTRCRRRGRDHRARLSSAGRCGLPVTKALRERVEAVVGKRVWLIEPELHDQAG
jgi:hypothetical protein